MIDSYLNQDLSWGAAGTPNEYNESTFTTTTIEGRKQTGFKLIRDATGNQVVSSALVLTKSLVEIGDLIDGSEIISVSPAIGLKGSELWQEAYLK